MESVVLTLRIVLGYALQGCHAVTTGWAHGPKQGTEYTVLRGEPAGKWHPAVRNILHLSTSGMGAGIGWVVVRQALANDTCSEQTFWPREFWDTLEAVGADEPGTHGG